MKENTWPIALFNGTVATTNGLYEISDIDTDTARELLQTYGFISAIGHEATATIMRELLEQPIMMNRIQFHQEVGQIAGQIINVEFNSITYQITFLSAGHAEGLRLCLFLLYNKSKRIMRCWNAKKSQMIDVIWLFFTWLL